MEMDLSDLSDLSDISDLSDLSDLSLFDAAYTILDENVELLFDQFSGSSTAQNPPMDQDAEGSNVAASLSNTDGAGGLVQETPRTAVEWTKNSLKVKSQNKRKYPDVTANILHDDSNTALQIFSNGSWIIYAFNNNYELRSKFNFLISSYFDRHSDISLCHFWEERVLGWENVKKTRGCIYQPLSDYVLERFNYDVYSELDDHSVRKLSSFLKNMKISYKVPNKRNVWLECTASGLLKNTHKIQAEYEMYPNIRRRSNLSIYYQAEEFYNIQEPNLLFLDTAISNKTVSLPVELCAIKINTIELGELSKRTREVMQVITSLTDHEYSILQDILRSIEFNEDVNLNQFHNP